MKNIPAFLAKKYLRLKTQDKNIAFMSIICFLGIFIGTFSLMLTLIITNGFEKTIYEKMQGINAQIIIHSPGNQLDYHAIAEVLEKEFASDLDGISGNLTKQAILEHNDTQNILFLKGIDPYNEYRVTNIIDKLTTPTPPTNTQKKQDFFKKLLEKNNIIVGFKTAQQLNLKLGDTLSIMIPEAGGRKKINLKKKSATISGIFKIGLEEYDNNFAFSSLNFIQETFDVEGVDSITLKLQDHSITTSFSSLWQKHKQTLSISFVRSAISILAQKISTLFDKNTTEKECLIKLKNRLPHLHVQSWKELYPALVSSLKLEKYVMFFILALITFVATMNMVALLFMQIQQKRRDIAIYKTMGLSDAKIRSIFLRIGLKITFWAATFGLGVAAVAGYFLEKYPFIELPDVYYVSHLPARMDIEIFLVVFFVTMLLGFIATWVPAQRARKVNIATVLRQE
jgi:lipoprotein-releasing system permease protein